MTDWLTPAEWQAVRLSLSVAARSVAFGLPLAVLAAVALARGRFWGRSLLDALVHLPLVMPPVVVGWGLLLLFGVRGPVGAWLNDAFGVRLVFTTAGAALATGIMAFPLMVRAIRLSLEGVDPGLEAAARTLGAGWLDRFCTVTLPLAIYAATQAPGAEATTAKLSAVSFTLAVLGLLLAELIARRMHRWLGR